MITSFLKQEFTRTPLTKMVAMLAMPMLKRFSRRPITAASTARRCWACAAWCSRATALPMRSPSRTR